MSDKKSKPAKADAKASGGKKSKRRKGDKVDAAGINLSIAGDPRARRSVREVRAWVGLASFGAALLLSLKAGVPLAIAGERALGAGMAGSFVAWGCAVAIWRALLTAELRAHVEQLKASREAAVVPTPKKAAS